MSPTRACSACRSPARLSAAWACSTCDSRSSSALRAASKSGWATGLGWRFEAADCCSSSATRVLSACTWASWALAWLCSLRRDRPTLLTTASTLTSSSQAAAAIFSQRAWSSLRREVAGCSWLGLLGLRGFGFRRAGCGDGGDAASGARRHAREAHRARSVIDGQFPGRAGECQQGIAQRQRPEPQMRRRQRQRVQRRGLRRVAQSR